MKSLNYSEDGLPGCNVMQIKIFNFFGTWRGRAEGILTNVFEKYPGSIIVSFLYRNES